MSSSKQTKRVNEPQSTKTDSLTSPEAIERYLAFYEDRLASFEEAVAAFGLPFEEEESSPREIRKALSDTVDSLSCENNGASLWERWISPACVACRKGMGTETFFASLKCTRNCYFCFNPNQENYEYCCTHERDIAEELREAYERGCRYRFLAVTGGEPVLHLPKVLEFIREAQRLYPGVHVRLYTSGDLLDEARLRQLADAGLSEIRFSVKLEDGKGRIEKTLAIIRASVGVVPAVMVEMPVMPDEYERMCELLVELDKMGADGINLLELGFPFNNAEEFARHGYKLRRRPYDVLYNYWYAGGIPVAGSEAACLRLLEFAAEHVTHLGVHYCSLDNKNSGQIYQQNWPLRAKWSQCAFSERDYFLKSVKVFGEDRAEIKRTLDTKGINGYRQDAEWCYLELNPEWVALLPPRLQQCAGLLSSYVVERDGAAPFLQEVAVMPVRLGDVAL